MLYIALLAIIGQTHTGPRLAEMRKVLSDFDKFEIQCTGPNPRVTLDDKVIAKDSVSADRFAKEAFASLLIQGSKGQLNLLHDLIHGEETMRAISGAFHAYVAGIVGNKADQAMLRQEILGYIEIADRAQKDWRVGH